MCKWAFPFVAGALIRKRALYQLRRYAVACNLEFEILDDDGGWFETEYLISVSGEETYIQRYKAAVLKWAKSLT